MYGKEGAVIQYRIKGFTGIWTQWFELVPGHAFHNGVTALMELEPVHATKQVTKLRLVWGDAMTYDFRRVPE